MIVFPEGRQVYNYDCGVSCLQSILLYYGQPIREEYLLDELKAVSTDIFNNGVKMKAIKDLAIKYGLNATIETLQIEDLENYINQDIPVIILVQAYGKDETDEENKDDNGHYVIPIDYEDNNMIFEDPSDFFRTFLTYEELNERWHAVSDNNKEDISNQAIIIKGIPDYNPMNLNHMD